MSIRHVPSDQTSELRASLEAMRRAQVSTSEPLDGATLEPVATLDSLNETERSAATIGVSPDSFRCVAAVVATGA